jgi:hypothetical protein
MRFNTFTQLRVLSLTAPVNNKQVSIDVALLPRSLQEVQLENVALHWDLPCTGHVELPLLFRSGGSTLTAKDS